MVSSLASPPDIIILTETWQSPDDPDLFSIDGYCCYHNVQGAGRGVVVSVFCAAEFSADRVPNLCPSNDVMEVCTVRVGLGLDVIYVVEIYRPHIKTMMDFSVDLTNLLQNDTLAYRKIVLSAGDMNIDLLKQDDCGVRIHYSLG